jgi:hypothetical protein
VLKNRNVGRFDVGTALERLRMAYRLLFAYAFFRPESEQNSSHPTTAPDAANGWLFCAMEKSGSVRSTAVEKHELSKIDFDIIDDAFKVLLQSKPDPAVADKVADLRDKFRDAFTGWLESEEAA